MKNGADLSRPLLQALARRLLQGPLQSPATNVQLIVAYSGGLDSHVLLHALSRAAAELPQLCPGYAGPAVDLRALHINHGLSPHADAWQQHCSNVCRALSIPFSVQKVTIDCRPGDSLEEQARLARYAAFEQLLQPQQHLLLAHHLDDQAETLLLRLLRQVEQSKAAPLEAVARHPAVSRYVGSHPMAGSERSGPFAASSIRIVDDAGYFCRRASTCRQLSLKAHWPFTRSIR